MPILQKRVQKDYRGLSIVQTFASIRNHSMDSNNSNVLKSTEKSRTSVF